MDFVIESLSLDWEAFLRFAPRLGYAAILLVIFLIAGKIAGRFVASLVQRSERWRGNRQFVQNLASWLVGSVGVLLALGIMGFHGVAASLLATGGVAAIIIGFAFREIGENFLAGIFLMFSRPFERGDLIKTGDLTGIVQSIEIRYIHIRTFDACDVFVPNAQMFREPLYNYTRDGLRRPSFTVGVAYHDNPDNVVELLRQAASNNPDVLDDPRPFVTVKEFAPQYIEYEVFFWLDVNKSDRSFIDIRNDVKISCWRALGGAGMTFSTDVTSALEILKAAPLEVALADRSQSS